MNLANRLTILRVLLIPIFIFSFYQPTLMYTNLTISEYKIPYSNIIGLIIFIVAALTDFIDGYVARRYNMITDLGKFMDPLADKLLVTAALLMLVDNALIPAWVVFIILAREFIVTGFRMVASAKGRVIAAGWLGKAKTVVQFVMVINLLLLNYPFELMNLPIDQILIVLSLVLSIASGIEYVYKDLDVLIA